MERLWRNCRDISLGYLTNISLIFGYRWAAEGLKPLTLFRTKKNPKICTLFRTTTLILWHCLGQRTKCALACIIYFISSYVICDNLFSFLIRNNHIREYTREISQSYTYRCIASTIKIRQHLSHAWKFQEQHCRENESSIKPQNLCFYVIRWSKMAIEPIKACNVITLKNL